MTYERLKIFSLMIFNFSDVKKRYPQDVSELSEFGFHHCTTNKQTCSFHDKDAWGTANKMEVNDSKNTLKIIVESAGPNGKFGDKDDIRIVENYSKPELNFLNPAVIPIRWLFQLHPVVLWRQLP